MSSVDLNGATGTRDKDPSVGALRLQAPVRPPETAPLIPPAPAPPAELGPPPAPTRRRWPLVAVAIGAVVLVVAAVLVWSALAGGPAPSDLRVLERDFASVTLSWGWDDDVTPSSFVLSRDGQQVIELPGTATRYHDAELIPATEYRYAVVAVVEQERTDAAEVVATTADLPDPSSLTVSDTGFGSATIAWGWDEGTAPEAFVIVRDGDEVAEVVGGATTYEDATIEPGTTYRYSVFARQGDVSSDPTAEVTATTPEIPPLSEAELAGDYRVAIRWTSVSNFSWNAGTTWRATWTLRPLANGARLNGFFPNTAGGSWSMRLQGTGLAYRGTAKAQIFDCSGVMVTDTLRVTIRLTAADVRGDAWVATHWTGTLHGSSPYVSVAGGYCSSGSYGADLEGNGRG